GFFVVISSSGGRKSAATQAGIAYIYVFAPIVLMVAALVFAKIFPMNKAEFEVIKREIARRKGEDNSKISAEEIAICEKVTGYSYDRFWNKENALKFK
ncbi:MAG: MFS transporter, partial [Lachnospiraceae bacterium]|nr:MFS transporter [Lachnospiraceae bacterium]